MWPNPQENMNLVTFTEEIINGKIHFCAVYVLKKLLSTSFLAKNFSFFKNPLEDDLNILIDMNERLTKDN